MRSDDPAAAHVQELIDGFCHDLGDRRFALTDAGAMLQSYPHLTGSVFDLPSVERGALAHLEGQGLTGRAGFVPGSFFDGPPPPADCYLLKYIIHDCPTASPISPTTADLPVPT
jgi:O-methyltransferase domain